MQKVIDRAWQQEAVKIYGEYAIYHQSDGAEQAVFTGCSGQPVSRSTRITERLLASFPLRDTGRLLDVGCGNGALLKVFSRVAPGWSLAGVELNDRYRQPVEGIDRVERLYTCAPDQIRGHFDIITMIHVLEHIPSPQDLLLALRDKLEPDGLLVIEVPDYLQNPFDLIIADHCTHFTTTTISRATEYAGFELLVATTEWVPRELTVVVRKRVLDPKNRFRDLRASGTDSFDSVVKRLGWLQSVSRTARQLANTGPFGIFGTSIAATWLFSELGEMASFFVDEDPNRAGRCYMGRPIYHPIDVPDDSHVFIALPRNHAEAVLLRCQKPGVTFHLPPQSRVGVRA